MKDETLNYRIVRSKRRTMSLHVCSDGMPEIRCPYLTPATEIDRFVRSKQAWIKKKQIAVQQHSIQRENFQLHFGDKARYLGNFYPITTVSGKKAFFDGEQFCLPEAYGPDTIKATLIKLYKQLAKACLTEKVSYFAQKYQLHPQGIRINSATTRWGSCSGKNRLNFSWKLIMSNEVCVNYVVLHELAHTKEHNHSPRFWRLVEAMMPDYPAAKQQLRAIEKRFTKRKLDNKKPKIQKT
jgi:Predicted metal-dependent hydrolase